MDIKGGISTPVDSGAYTDVNRLASLKHGDKDSVANQKKVAQEFESLFVSQMLKAMRSANEVLAKDNPMNTAATRQYQDMYDQQLAVTLSTRGNGIGLQDVLMRQLSKDKGIKHAAPTDQAATTADPAAPARPVWRPASISVRCGPPVRWLPIRRLRLLRRPVKAATTWRCSMRVVCRCRPN